MSERHDTKPDLLGPDGLADVLNLAGVEAKKKAFGEQVQAKEGFQDSLAKMNALSDGAAVPLTPGTGLPPTAPVVVPVTDATVAANSAPALQPDDHPKSRAQVTPLHLRPAPSASNGARVARPPSITALLLLIAISAVGLAIFGVAKLLSTKDQTPLPTPSSVSGARQIPSATSTSGNEPGLPSTAAISATAPSVNANTPLPPSSVKAPPQSTNEKPTPVLTALPQSSSPQPNPTHSAIAPPATSTPPASTGDGLMFKPK